MAPSSPNWLVDSGASHLVSTSLHNLSLHNDYDETEEILLGDGINLKIMHTGTSQLLSTSKPFVSSNVLCFLHMKKNLLSVLDYVPLIMFLLRSYHLFFYVNDLHRWPCLIEGRIKDGVYEWLVYASDSVKQFSKFHSSLAYSEVPIVDWHNRLRHPYTKILS